MANWGANHGAISYGHIGADLISLASMLRIPVNMHNVPGRAGLPAERLELRSAPPIPKAPTSGPARPSARSTARRL